MLDKLEYQTTKKDLDKLLEKADSEALEGGCNLIDKHYREARTMLKNNILKAGEISPEDFEQCERRWGDGTELLEEAKDKEHKVDTLAKRIMDRIKGKKND